MMKVSRRSALKGMAAVGALSGSAFTKWAEAWAQASPFRPEQGATLNMMRWRRFVVAEDEAFNKIMLSWLAANR